MFRLSLLFHIVMSSFKGSSEASIDIISESESANKELFETSFMPQDLCKNQTQAFEKSQIPADGVSIKQHSPATELTPEAETTAIKETLTVTPEETKSLPINVVLRNYPKKTNGSVRKPLMTKWFWNP
jgi:hypothetical protein